MLKDSLKAIGDVYIELKNEVTGEVETRHIPNLVMDLGKAFIAQSMMKTTTDSPARMTHMGIGDSSTAAAANQTDLIAATNKVRVALTSQTSATQTVANDSVSYVATFPAGTGTFTVTEAGIFNASSAGTMLCRTVFGAITKGASDSLTITWRVTIA